MTALRPSLKTKIQGEGIVVHRDVTRFGLHRMCVATYAKYPDIEVWLTLLNTLPFAHRYTERIVSDVFIGYLWLYWKE